MIRTRDIALSLGGDFCGKIKSNGEIKNRKLYGGNRKSIVTEHGYRKSGFGKVESGLSAVFLRRET